MCEIDGWLEVDVQHREPSLVLFDDLEGGMGEGEGFKRESIITADLHFCMTESHHNIVKLLSSN